MQITAVVLIVVGIGYLVIWLVFGVRRLYWRQRPVPRRASLGSVNAG